jgi:hypothetical protein
MRVSDYYKLVVPHRHWTTEFQLHSPIMYGVCYIEHHPNLRPNRTQRPRVRAQGFHLKKMPTVYAPVWAGHKPNFEVVGYVLSENIYSYLPVDIIKIILKYL